MSLNGVAFRDAIIFVKKMKIIAVVSHKVLYYQRKVVILWAKVKNLSI